MIHYRAFHRVCGGVLTFDKPSHWVSAWCSVCRWTFVWDAGDIELREVDPR